ncbi:MAG: hypothetical protein HOA57_04640 [Candidatus Magasanikbacteria bacterium]|jgi:branched-chain amino acid aminotransferase|nr:hypothetical protein [Candidatus Magasanikbacteria bacterium]MBT4314854.1 hypothetical protein [Candidatus Magasanikbacteria bacterium]MBT4546759.1 hypothetical protein [Candidatus Magasanikbacteria bacterium]MBT6819632.1 hypothetical protein [Candidatus Magasanikbacteria bacterium]
MLGKYFSHSGKLLPVKKAKISIDNIEFTYGFGVYENLRVRKGKIFFINEHVERLFKSAEMIELKHNFNFEEIKTAIEKLIKKNRLEDCNIKMLLIGGEKPDLYIICLAPKFLDRKFYKQGVKVITENHERFLPQAKTLNMLPSYLIFKRAKEQDAYDVLLLDKENNIVEGARSNFFAIKNKTLYTTPVEKVLDGVTRRTVIDCAKRNGYEVVEKDIELNDLFNYDGAFLTSTSGKIVPIREVGEGGFEGICEELKELMKFYSGCLK